jgi:hypothetical protein
MQKFPIRIIIILLALYPAINIHGQFIITAETGYSYRLMLTPDSVSSSYASYFNKKRSGINFNGEIVYFNENQGIGFRYNSFINKVSGKKIEIPGSAILDKSENIHINYYSIQYHKRKNFNKSKFYAGFCFGLGYVQYMNTGKEAAEEIDLSGSTYGLNLALSLEYKIYKHLSFHISPNFFMAVLNQYLMNGNTVMLKKKESLSTLDTNGGVSVIF